MIKAGDEFWTKAETLLYCALFGYIHYEAPEEEQNFNTLLEFLNASEVREDDEDYENPVDKAKEVHLQKSDVFGVMLVVHHHRRIFGGGTVQGARL